MLNFRFDEMHHRRQISTAESSQSSLELSISRLLTVLACTACLVVVLSDYILSVLSWGHGTLAKNKQFVKKILWKASRAAERPGLPENFLTVSWISYLVDGTKCQSSRKIKKECQNVSKSWDFLHLLKMKK